MKKQSGKDMIVFGSGSIVSQLTEHGLIDEYELVVCPVFLGGGRSLLSDMSKTHEAGSAGDQATTGRATSRYARAS